LNAKNARRHFAAGEKKEKGAKGNRRMAKNRDRKGQGIKLKGSKGGGREGLERERGGESVPYFGGKCWQP